jgi:DNA-binding MarR family transcriptional regulator
MGDHPAFDELIHAPKRLRICAVLAAAAAAEFATLRDALDVSDSVLSKHLTALESVDYISTSRELRDSRQRVWVSLTPTGRRAYAGHVQALQQIMMMDQATRPSETQATAPMPEHPAAVVTPPDEPAA